MNTNKMKAIVSTKYGQPDVMEFKEIEKPAPKDNEVLVKVHASSVNAADWHMLTADIFLIRLMGMGFFKPKYTILGADIAGRVESVGQNVRQFKPGDEVYGDLANFGWGGLAEYVSVPEGALDIKPTNLSFDEAAAIPLAAITALQGLRDIGKIQADQKVLISGASGGVGTFAVQIAKSFGAEVTAVCSSRNMEMASSIGADWVIDYTKEDFTRNGKKYDIIIAANGYHPILDYKRALSPTGIYVMTGGAGAQMFQAMAFGPLLSKKDGRQMRSLSMKAKQKDLVYIKELVEAGKVSPVIERRYSLSEAPDAFRYFGKGHARGKVVITVTDNN